MLSRKEFTRQVTEAAEMGVAMVGKRKALHAALAAQHLMLADLFKLTHGVVEKARAKGKPLPVLPMTDEVLSLVNNCIGGCQMVATLMTMGCLDEDRPEDDITYALDHSVKAGATKH